MSTMLTEATTGRACRCTYCHCHVPERRVLFFRNLPFCSVFHYREHFRLT